MDVRVPFKDSHQLSSYYVLRYKKTRHLCEPFDHASNDWRDVVSHKIDVPTAIFTGENSNNVPSQKWMQSQIPESELHVYSKEEQGNHFLAFKNPTKSTNDLTSFLER